MKKPYLALCLAATLLSAGCNSKNPTAPSTGILDGSATYTTSGNKLILFTPEQEVRHCDGLNLVTETQPADTDTIFYELSGNTLSLWEDSSTFASGAIAVEKMIFGRSGSGSGLPGTWNFQDVEYAITGTATTAEQDSVATEASAESLALANTKLQVRVQGTSVSYYITPDISALFVANSPVDTSLFDIAFSGSGSALEMTGNKSHEVVTVSMNSQQDVIIASSNTQHATHTYYQNPTTCPNDMMPEWFEQFFLSNLKLQFKTSRLPAFDIKFKVPQIQSAIPAQNPISIP